MMGKRLFVVLAVVALLGLQFKSTQAHHFSLGP
jgi:hypothetical protein